ncbi:MAG: IS66 family transposase [Treponema sp.]|jgi:transposase|nr:IS66 family transposase [Treponema sp.]
MGTASAASEDVKSYSARLEEANRQLQETNQNNIIQFEKKVAILEQENQYLQEKLKLALFRQFARHAERFVGEGQLPLFDSGEGTAPPAGEQTDETETVRSYNRTKRGRKPIDEHIPRIDEMIDIPEADKQCACGSALVCIGEDVAERLVMVPEQVYVIRYHMKKYACHECEGSGDEERPAVRRGEAPKNLLPGSITTPELLSYIFTKKYCDYTPYFRQEAAFGRIGIRLSRQNMANWQQRVTEKLHPLFGLLKEHIRSGTVVQMDETTMTVMDEPGRANGQKSYMWLARGGPPGRPALWYEYRQTREKKHIAEILGGFRGYLQSDGYSSYESAAEQDMTGVIHVGCWAHARRKFFEAMKLAAKGSLAEVALSWIKGLYTVEKDLRAKLQNETIDAETFEMQRRERCEPILRVFREWLEENRGIAPASSKIGEAINYALNEWHTLERYVLDWQLTPDNNACERGIRPFVMGRKNWVMSGSPAGAKSSCELYTLIETAKANNRNPVKYLTRLFEKATAMRPSDDWSQLLPWNLTL